MRASGSLLPKMHTVPFPNAVCHSRLLFLKLRGPELWHFYAENSLLAEGKCASPMRWHQVLSGDCSLSCPTPSIPAASKSPGISLEPGFLVTWVPLCILLSLLQLSHMKTGPSAVSSECPQSLLAQAASFSYHFSATRCHTELQRQSPGCLFRILTGLYNFSQRPFGFTHTICVLINSFSNGTKRDFQFCIG